jgi:hypothetical protein
MQSEFNKPWQASFLDSLPVMEETPVLDAFNNGSSSGSIRSYPLSKSSGSYSRQSSVSFGNNGSSRSELSQPFVTDARASPVLVEEVVVIEAEKPKRSPFPMPYKSMMSSGSPCAKDKKKMSCGFPKMEEVAVPPCGFPPSFPSFPTLPSDMAPTMSSYTHSPCSKMEKEKEMCMEKEKKKSGCAKMEKEKEMCMKEEKEKEKEKCKPCHPIYKMEKEKSHKDFEIIQTLELPELSSFDVICDMNKRIALVECEYKADVSLMAAPENECVEFSHYFNTDIIGQYFYDIRDVALLVVNCDNYFYICPVKIAEPCKKGMKADVKLKIKHFCGPKILRDGIYPVFCSVPECEKFVCATRAAQVVWAEYLVECFGHMFKELEHNKHCIETMAKKVCQKDFSAVPCDKLAEFLDCLNCNIKKWKHVMKQLDIETGVKEITSYLTCPPEPCVPKCEKKKC